MPSRKMRTAIFLWAGMAKSPKMDPGIFPKSQNSKISCSSHSENAHIKLNGFQSIFGGWGDMPFIFFMGWMLRFGLFGPLPGSTPTHPSCLSTRGGAIGICVFDTTITSWLSSRWCQKRSAQLEGNADTSLGSPFGERSHTDIFKHKLGSMLCSS